LSPRRPRLPTEAVNHLYELGWREGWCACLQTIEREGLAAVQANEALLAQNHPLPLQLEHEELLDR